MLLITCNYDEIMIDEVDLTKKHNHQIFVFFFQLWHYLSSRLRGPTVIGWVLVANNSKHPLFEAGNPNVQLTAAAALKKVAAIAFAHSI